MDKAMVCIDCGELPTDGSKLNLKGRCIQCAIKRQLNVATQLHNHEGPYYDKWREAMKAAARRL